MFLCWEQATFSAQATASVGISPWLLFGRNGIAPIRHGLLAVHEQIRVVLAADTISATGNLPPLILNLEA